MQNWIDMHTHTHFSFDAEAQLSEHCARAEALHFSAFAITDHCDVNAQPLQEAKANIGASLAEARALREGKPFELLLGVELGEPLEDLGYAEEIMGLAAYDYLLGSIHNTPGQPDFYYFEEAAADLPAVLTPYFEELIRLTQWGKIDAIAHITYPLRYIEGKYKRAVDLTRYADLLDELFRTLIQKDLTLEINASGLRQEIGRPFPDECLLRRYYELGGRRITFGSDAHKACDFGAGIAECAELARKIGFTQATFYRQRQAVSLPL